MLCAEQDNYCVWRPFVRKLVYMPAIKRNYSNFAYVKTEGFISEKQELVGVLATLKCDIKHV